MVTLMDDQNGAWQRLTDARLAELEAAVQPRRVRRNAKGIPMRPLPYEPGDRTPLPRWTAVRLMAVEVLLRLMLDADASRADDMDVEELEDLMRLKLDRLHLWSRTRVEPDILNRELIAAFDMAEAVLTEAYTHPLIELEEEGL
jgi:hypothetical protein